MEEINKVSERKVLRDTVNIPYFQPLVFFYDLESYVFVLGCFRVVVLVPILFIVRCGMVRGVFPTDHAGVSMLDEHTYVEVCYGVRIATELFDVD